MLYNRNCQRNLVYQGIIPREQCLRCYLQKIWWLRHRSFSPVQDRCGPETIFCIGYLRQYNEGMLMQAHHPTWEWKTRCPNCDCLCVTYVHIHVLICIILRRASSISKCNFSIRNEVWKTSFEQVNISFKSSLPPSIYIVCLFACLFNLFMPMSLQGNSGGLTISK